MSKIYKRFNYYILLFYIFIFLCVVYYYYPQYYCYYHFRYGFKVWSLCSARGMGLYFEPYCGADTDISDIGLGQGPNVVMSLIEKAGVQRGSELYFDNLFTSFSLLQKLSSLGIGGTGTVRNNKLHRVPLPEAKTVENMERVLHDLCTRVTYSVQSGGIKRLSTLPATSTTLLGRMAATCPTKGEPKGTANKPAETYLSPGLM